MSVAQLEALARRVRRFHCMVGLAPRPSRSSTMTSPRPCSPSPAAHRTGSPRRGGSRRLFRSAPPAHRNASVAGAPYSFINAKSPPGSSASSPSPRAGSDGAGRLPTTASSVCSRRNLQHEDLPLLQPRVPAPGGRRPGTGLLLTPVPPGVRGGAANLGPEGPPARRSRSRNAAPPDRGATRALSGSRTGAGVTFRMPNVTPEAPVNARVADGSWRASS